MTIGFAAGPLVAGVLAQWAPAPTVVPYLPHLVIAAVALPLVMLTAEPPAQRTDAPPRGGAFRDPRFLRDAGYLLFDSPFDEGHGRDLAAGDVHRRAPGAWPALASLASADAGRFVDACSSARPCLELDASAELFHVRQRLGCEWGAHQHMTPLVLTPISTRVPSAARSAVDGPAAARDIVIEHRWLDA